jgi:co-chaperonin GroES (HSP10)
MSKLTPVNDYFMVEVRSKEENPMGLVGTPDVEEGVRFGVIVAISDKMLFFGYNTFAYDSSLGNEEILSKVYDFYKGWVGKKVYWPERSESGAVIEYNDKNYAFLKMSAVMGIEES